MLMICIWVRILTVPMHLSLINGPFVPHNLISVQGCPVPLLKFQVAARLKLLMSSGSKKKEHRYAFSFFLLRLLKVPANETPPGSPTGALYGESCPFTGSIYISLKFLTTIPLNTERFFPSLKNPMKGAYLYVPQNRGPYTPVSRALLSIIFGVLSRVALLPGAPHRAPSERDAPFQNPFLIHLSKSLVNEPPTRFSKVDRVVVEHVLLRILRVSPCRYHSTNTLYFTETTESQQQTSPLINTF